MKKINNINENKLSPIIIFCYLRKDHLEKTLEALSQNKLAAETEVFIYSDGPKNSKQIPIIDDLRKFLKEYNKNSNFKKVTIIESKLNKGLANSIITGVTEIINIYGKVIVMEDDLISSSMYLEYMNESLNMYESNSKVWSISGYTPNLKTLEKNEEFFFIQRPWSWGWATWKDRWEKSDWEVKDFNKFIKNRKQIKEFNKCGNNMTEMLISQVQKRKYINSWYVRFAYSQFKNNGLTLYPIKSYIENIGIDGSGTHSSESNKKIWQIDLNQNFYKNKLPKNISEHLLFSKIIKNKSQVSYLKGLIARYLDNFKLYDFIKKYK
ncbi:MAG: sugar transferase [Cetobacterium sp.]